MPNAKTCSYVCREVLERKERQAFRREVELRYSIENPPPEGTKWLAVKVSGHSDDPNSKFVFATVDANVYELGCDQIWCLSSKYPRTASKRFGVKHAFFLHHLIIGTPLVKGIEVDHINRDRLDNRKANLRVISKADNSRNRSTPSNSSTGYIGVSYYQKYGAKPYRAHITFRGRKISLGLYKTAKEASEARTRAATEFHVRLNPNGSDVSTRFNPVMDVFQQSSGKPVGG